MFENYGRTLLRQKDKRKSRSVKKRKKKKEGEETKAERRRKKSMKDLQEDLQEDQSQVTGVKINETMHENEKIPIIRLPTTKGDDDEIPERKSDVPAKQMADQSMAFASFVGVGLKVYTCRHAYGRR